MSEFDQLDLIGRWFVGKKPTFTASFYAEATGALTNPSTVKFVTRNPAGTETTYVFGVATEVTNPSTGIFKFAMPQLAASHVGQWSIRVNGTGTVVTSDEATFEVLDTEFATPLP